MSIVHESYTELIQTRYERASKESVMAEGDYSYVMLAPYQYRVEASMLRYVRSNPNATLREAALYLDSICPTGLPPGDDGCDLLEE